VSTYVASPKCKSSLKSGTWFVINCLGCYIVIPAVTKVMYFTEHTCSKNSIINGT